jgi:hypothetical protein
MNEFKTFSNNVPLQNVKVIKLKIQIHFLMSGVNQITAQFKTSKVAAVIIVAKEVTHQPPLVKIALVAVTAQKVIKNQK